MKSIKEGEHEPEGLDGSPGGLMVEFPEEMASIDS
jgi:hypothetical protein